MNKPKQKQVPIIFFDQDKETYFANSLISDLSGRPITQLGLLVRGFSRNKKIGFDFLICDYDERVRGVESFNLNLYDYRDTIRIQIKDRIPDNVKLYTFPKPTLKNSKNDFSVYDLADKQREDEVIIDKTVHSFRNQNAPDSISFEEAQLKLQTRDLELDSPLDDPTELLKKLKEASNKAVEENKKRLLQ